MKLPLFAFVLGIAAVIVVAYVALLVIALLRGSAVGGCGWLILTLVAANAVWVLLYLASEVGGVHMVPAPW